MQNRSLSYYEKLCDSLDAILSIEWIEVPLPNLDHEQDSKQLTEFIASEKAAFTKEKLQFVEGLYAQFNKPQVDCTQLDFTNKVNFLIDTLKQVLHEKTANCKSEILKRVKKQKQLASQNYFQELKLFLQGLASDIVKDLTPKITESEQQINESIAKHYNADDLNHALTNLYKELQTKISASISAYYKAEYQKLIECEEICCGISHEMLEEPRVTKYGHIFEKSRIEEWLTTSNQNCPLTRAPLTRDDIAENATLAALFKAPIIGIHALFHQFETYLHSLNELPNPSKLDICIQEIKQKTLKVAHFREKMIQVSAPAFAKGDLIKKIERAVVFSDRYLKPNTLFGTLTSRYREDAYQFITQYLRNPVFKNLFLAEAYYELFQNNCIEAAIEIFNKQARRFKSIQPYIYDALNIGDVASRYHEVISNIPSVFPVLTSEMLKDWEHLEASMVQLERQEVLLREHQALEEDLVEAYKENFIKVIQNEQSILNTPLLKKMPKNDYDHYQDVIAECNQLLLTFEEQKEIPKRNEILAKLSDELGDLNQKLKNIFQKTLIKQWQEKLELMVMTLPEELQPKAPVSDIFIPEWSVAHQEFVKRRSELLSRVNACCACEEQEQLIEACQTLEQEWTTFSQSLSSVRRKKTELLHALHVIKLMPSTKVDLVTLYQNICNKKEQLILQVRNNHIDIEKAKIALEDLKVESNLYQVLKRCLAPISLDDFGDDEIQKLIKNWEVQASVMAHDLKERMEEALDIKSTISVIFVPICKMYLKMINDVFLIVRKKFYDCFEAERLYANEDFDRFINNFNRVSEWQLRILKNIKVSEFARIYAEGITFLEKLYAPLKILKVEQQKNQLKQKLAEKAKIYCEIFHLNDDYWQPKAPTLFSSTEPAGIAELREIVAHPEHYHSELGFDEAVDAQRKNIKTPSFGKRKKIIQQLKDSPLEELYHNQEALEKDTLSFLRVISS